MQPTRYLILAPLALAALAGCAERHEAAPATKPAAEHATPAEPAKEKSATAEKSTTAEKPAGKAASNHDISGPSPLEAIARLSAGNARFASGRRSRSADATDDAEERALTAKGQHPFAAVLTCADSRLAPELLFDQSIGDIFVVRNAGNIAEPVGEGSMEYGVEHLGIRLIIVLGHQSCGAVKAVAGTDGPLPGNLAAIQRNMPGLQAYAATIAKTGKDPIPAAVIRNAIDQATALLRESDSLRKAVEAGTLAVVPAVYELDSGLIEFLKPVDPADAR